MSDRTQGDEHAAERVPYRLPQPTGIRPDQVIPDALSAVDDPHWVPLGRGIWVRPLQFNVTIGQWTHFMRVTRSGVVARHRHTGMVHAYVFRGRWHYLEHDWTAEAGTFVFEPPGETHTLVVPDGCDEMITLFQVNGSLTYVDPDGRTTGYDDVFTRLQAAREHFERVGLGAGYVDAFIR